MNIYHVEVLGEHTADQVTGGVVVADTQAAASDMIVADTGRKAICVELGHYTGPKMEEFIVLIDATYERF